MHVNTTSSKCGNCAPTVLGAGTYTTCFDMFWVPGNTAAFKAQHPNVGDLAQTSKVRHSTGTARYLKLLVLAKRLLIFNCFDEESNSLRSKRFHWLFRTRWSIFCFQFLSQQPKNASNVRPMETLSTQLKKYRHSDYYRFWSCNTQTTLNTFLT